MMHTPSTLSAVEFYVATIVDVWKHTEDPEILCMQIDLGSNLKIHVASRQLALVPDELLYRRVLVEIDGTATPLGNFISMGKILSSLNQGQPTFIEAPPSMKYGIPYRLVPQGPAPIVEEDPV